ncbi:MAG TPA: amidohydrolase [Mycobacteriales bacterium]|nr:amidohydrolase [Mycobacteriales bacterium]
MPNDLLLQNVRVSGGEPADVLVHDGWIERIGPGLTARPDVPILDGGSRVLLPGFVDAHSHLDKSLLGMPWYSREPGRSLHRTIADERALRLAPDWDYERQIGRNVEVLVAAGTTHTRAFVDIDLDAKLAGLEGMLAVKDKYAHALDMQIIAFAQSGIAAHPGTAELLDSALAAGADVIGGLDPCLVERDPVTNLDLLFGLAGKHGKGVDIHLHEPGPLGAFSAELIIERTRATGMGGQVVISHPDFLGGIGEPQAGRIIEAMVEAGVAVTTNVPGSDPKPPLRRMIDAGLRMGSGCDGALDSWGPLNRSDMLFKAYEMAWRYGLGTDDDLGLALRMVTAGGAAVMGLDDHGVEPGCRADLVLVPGQVAVEPIVALPAERTVIKAGRVVAVDGVCR